MLRPSVVLAFALLGTTGCRDTLPCTDCGENADDLDDGPLPDLPCDGADLMTDNENCGACGIECPLWFEGSDFEAGTCRQGSCGAVWSGCVAEGQNPFSNCEEICLAYGTSCVAGGCSGYTALLTEVGFEDNCSPIDKPTVIEMTGSCDEPLPWLTTDETSREAMCCCEQP